MTRATTKTGRKQFVHSRQRYTPGQIEVLQKLAESEAFRERVVEDQLRIIRLARKLNLTWSDIGQVFNITGPAAWSRYYKGHKIR
jgi:hypothetical protein